MTFEIRLLWPEPSLMLQAAVSSQPGGCRGAVDGSEPGAAPRGNLCWWKLHSCAAGSQKTPGVGKNTASINSSLSHCRALPCRVKGQNVGTPCSFRLLSRVLRSLGSLGCWCLPEAPKAAPGNLLNWPILLFYQLSLAPNDDRGYFILF